MLLRAPAPAIAQAVEPLAGARRRAAPPTRVIDFSADQVTYDSDADMVTASGAVRMSRDGNYLAADQVVWNRKTGRGPRPGQCRPDDPAGRQADRRQCRADRHAARRHRRQSAASCSTAAAGSPRRAAVAQRRRHDPRQCDLFALPGDQPSGCPKRPSWAITAARVIYDPAHRTRSASRADGCSCSASTCRCCRSSASARGTGGVTGWLVPDISYLDPQGARARHALSLAVRPQPRPDDDAASLHRRPAGDRGQVPPAQSASAPSSSAASSPTARIDNADPDVPRRRPPRLSRLFRSQWQGSSSIPLWSITSSLRVGDRQDRHPALRHHPRRPAAQLRQCRADQPRPPTSASPAGRSRACASTTSRSRFRSRCRRSTRASGSTTVARRQGRAAGQQPGDPAHRGPGHPARLRQRALGPAAADAVGPGADC